MKAFKCKIRRDKRQSSPTAVALFDQKCRKYQITIRGKSIKRTFYVPICISRPSKINSIFFVISNISIYAVLDLKCVPVISK